MQLVRSLLNSCGFPVCTRLQGKEVQNPPSVSQDPHYNHSVSALAQLIGLKRFSSNGWSGWYFR